MGTVYRKTATKPLPAGAKIITRKGEKMAGGGGYDPKKMA